METGGGMSSRNMTRHGQVLLTGGCGANVRAQGERIHSLERDDTDASQGSEGRGEDGRRLHQDGEDATSSDGCVVDDDRVREDIVTIHGSLDQLGNVTTVVRICET